MPTAWLNGATFVIHGAPNSNPGPLLAALVTRFAGWEVATHHVQDMFSLGVMCGQHEPDLVIADLTAESEQSPKKFRALADSIRRRGRNADQTPIIAVLDPAQEETFGAATGIFTAVLPAPGSAVDIAEFARQLLLPETD